MQFVHQHPEYCERLVLISSGGLGPDLGRSLRLLSTPGVELLLPVIAARPVVSLGERIRQTLSRGLLSVELAEGWKAYSSLGDPESVARYPGIAGAPLGTCGHQERLMFG